MAVFPVQGANKGIWGTDLRSFFSPTFDLSTNLFNISQHVLFASDATYDVGSASKRAKAGYFSGTITAGSFSGDGSALTGIASGTGGVINTGSTTIGADSDSTGGGEIAFQIKGVTEGSFKNNGNFLIGPGSDVGVLTVNRNVDALGGILHLKQSGANLSSGNSLVYIDGSGQVGNDAWYALHYKGFSGSNDFFMTTSGKIGLGVAPSASKFAVVGLPTSAAGLAAGDVWNNSGVLNIA